MGSSSASSPRRRSTSRLRSPWPRQEQLQRLIEQARRRHAGEQLAQPRDRLGSRRVDLEAELRLEARRAQHAHRVFAKARLRIADQAQAPGGTSSTPLQ